MLDAVSSGIDYLDGVLRYSMGEGGGCVRDVVVENVGTNLGDRSGCNQLQLRMPLPDGLVELREAGIIRAGLVMIFLIADFHQL